MLDSKMCTMWSRKKASEQLSNRIVVKTWRKKTQSFVHRPHCIIFQKFITRWLLFYSSFSGQGVKVLTNSETAEVKVKNSIQSSFPEPVDSIAICMYVRVELDNSTYRANLRLQSLSGVSILRMSFRRDGWVCFPKYFVFDFATTHDWSSRTLIFLNIYQKRLKGMVLREKFSNSQPLSDIYI